MGGRQHVARSVPRGDRAVPFVDVINTMTDTTLPLTVGEFEEGNPAGNRRA
jgi:protease II